MSWNLNPPSTPTKSKKQRSFASSQDSTSTYLASPSSPRNSTDKKLKHGYDDDTYGSSDDGSFSHTDSEDEDEGDGLLDKHIELDRSTLATLPVEEEEHIQEVDALQQEQPKEKPKPVSWSSLPKKDQLFILTFARLSEPLTQTSLQAYMFYQLRSFDPALPDSIISYRAGLLQATFTGAQFCTAFLWGRIADSERMGRKRVILIGLIGTSIGALGFGFSQTFYTALFWRALGGALNGNVGVMRTMISEIIKEKKYQSRAFLLLPMTFNIGVIVGPIIGGLLADPLATYPSVFGENSILGGEHGVWWMKRWPYALPNIVTAAFMTIATTVAILGLEETLDSLRGKRDLGLRIGDLIKRYIFCRPSHDHYQTLIPSDIELQQPTTPIPLHTRRKLPFRRIFTPNMIAVLIAHGMLASHLGAFNSLWFVFLSTPRYIPHSSTGVDPNSSLHLPPSYHPKPPFIFTGGLGLPPAAIGVSLAILGTIGIVLQLGLYPTISFRYGNVSCYRLALLFFPVVYAAVPFLALIPTTLAAPAPASGTLFWAALVVILAVHVLARTFALPGTTILVNNACPHPSVLGTVHGLGQSASSLTRTFGPLLGGLAYGHGLKAGVVGAVFWAMATWAMLGFAAGTKVREGDGHEILLEGEEKDGS
ncbi:MFS transporter [Myriangium duriaei CBS 260.36]|uniref:MFS transporter n=1 Tax=Myriangium duriaei CBS 260.36 TaxID=1168546 RepID=A0A9P4MH73_9PEZI|nr:MFS transporter [Myriangium duriaei CBS 260.36]